MEQIGIAAVRVRILVLLGCHLCGGLTYCQMLPSQARGAARAQVAMLSVSGGCAAGIIAGYDDKAVYIATAAHVADLSAPPFPEVKVKFEGLGNAGKTGRFRPQFEKRDQGDLAVVAVSRDAAIDKFLNELDFAMLAPVPLSPADSPVTSVGCFGGGEWSSGSNETLLAPDQGYLRFQSSVGEGQSGGGLFNEAWELIGMPLDVGPNGVYARPISQIVEDLRKWGIPVHLSPRPLANRARGADEVARENAAGAKSRELAATATAKGALAADLGLLLAVEAIKIKDTPEARSALLRLLAETRGLGGFLGPSVRGTKSLAFAPDGRTLAIGVPGGVRVWDVVARSELQRLPLSGPAPECVAISSDLVAAGTKDGKLIVWPQRGTKELFRIPVGDLVTSIIFTQPESSVVAGDISGNVAVVSLKDGSVQRVQGEQGPVSALQLYEFLGGKVLTAGGGQGRVTQWDFAKLDQPKTSAMLCGRCYASVYDEKLHLFYGFNMGVGQPFVSEFNAWNWTDARSLSGNAIEVDAAALSGDGMLLAAGAMQGGRIALWDTALAQRRPYDLVGHPGKVQALAVSHDAAQVAAGGDGGVTLFELGTQPLVNTIRAKGAVSIDEVPNMIRAGISAAFNADGSLLAWPVGGASREVVVWDLAHNKERARLKGDGVYAFSKDERAIGVETFESKEVSVVGLGGEGILQTEPEGNWVKRKKGSVGVTTGEPWAVDNGGGLGSLHRCRWNCDTVGYSAASASG